MLLGFEDHEPEVAEWASQPAMLQGPGDPRCFDLPGSALVGDLNVSLFPQAAFEGRVWELCNAWPHGKHLLMFSCVFLVLSSS